MKNRLVERIRKEARDKKKTGERLVGRKSVN
jgi:hypothetical protein